MLLFLGLALLILGLAPFFLMYYGATNPTAFTNFLTSINKIPLLSIIYGTWFSLGFMVLAPIGAMILLYLFSNWTQRQMRHH